jgi:hypothetical protein
MISSAAMTLKGAIFCIFKAPSVVGDGNAVDSQFLAALDYFIQRRAAVHGVFGVYMQVGF